MGSERPCGRGRLPWNAEQWSGRDAASGASDRESFRGRSDAVDASGPSDHRSQRSVASRRFFAAVAGIASGRGQKTGIQEMKRVVVLGGGPAGAFAAERLARAG